MRAVDGGGHALSFAIRRPTTVSARYGGTRRRCPAKRRLESTSPEKKADKSLESTTSPPTSSSVPAAPAAQVPKHVVKRVLRNSVLGRAADAYSRSQDTRPYWTQFWSTVVIYLCGDLVAQLVISGGSAQLDGDEETDEDGERKNAGLLGTYDPLRTARHLTVGAIAAIPVYRWFMFLHSHFNFASRGLSITTKVIVSQAVFTPVFNTYFFSAQSLLAGASLPETFDRLVVAVPTSFINSCKLWPAVTALLFAYVDPRFRSVVSGVVAVGWQSYLSWLNQRAAREVAAEERAAAVTAAAMTAGEGKPVEAAPVAAAALTATPA